MYICDIGLSWVEDSETDIYVSQSRLFNSGLQFAPRLTGLKERL